MKSFAHFLVAAVIVSLVIMSPVLGQQPIQKQLRSQCPQRDAIPALREELSRCNCSVDVVLIPDGYALVVTTNNTKDVAAMQKAINAFYSGSGDTKLSASGGSCAAIKAAIATGKVHHAIAKLSNGVLLTVTSRDDSLVKLIRDNDCCNWCVCNSPCSHSCCGSCCK